MYNDDRGTKREGWVYPYKGSDLLPFARRKLAEHRDAERAAREYVSEKIRDAGNNDDGIEKARRDIAVHGNTREQCQVFAHEFERNPDREFTLSLGDVVFFGIVVD